MRGAVLRTVPPRLVVIVEAGLLDLLIELKARDYGFTCVSPATHATIAARPPSGAPTLRDIFGWNRTFLANELAPQLLEILRRADCVEEKGKRLRSRVRVAGLGGHLFLHSSYPTDRADAVFFGPDSYRFASFVSAQLPTLPAPGRIFDWGCGSGVGGINCARLAPSAEIMLADVNPLALSFAAVNAKAAGVSVGLMEVDRPPPGCALIIANPPYMMDDDHRTYRDGGGLLGGEVACRWARQSLQVLLPGGTMLLYTGAAVVEGQAPLLERIEELCREAGADWRIEEIDPDVFGEELRKPAYADVERIAAYGIRITNRSADMPLACRHIPA